MFYGCELTFDGKSCTDFGLMLYDFSSNRQEDVSLASPGEMITDHVPGRYDTYLYGIDQSKQLEYKLILCAGSERANAHNFYTRSEIANIAKWLCGHQKWKWLSIDQPDMTQYQFRCMVTSMTILTSNAVPWAFEFTVCCDSPYAYKLVTWSTEDAGVHPELFSLVRSDSYHGYLYPVLEIFLSGSGLSNFTLTNASDTARQFKFTDLPNFVTKLRVDCDKQTITAYSGEEAHDAVVDSETGDVITPAVASTLTELSTNVFPYFNKQFFRLKDGSNVCTLSGDVSKMTMSYYAPYDIGA